MLRITLLVLSLFVTILVSAQDNESDDKDVPYLLVKDKNGNYQYEEVITYDSTKITKESAYKNAKQYIVSTLKTADNNIAADDKDFSQLINTGNLILKPTHGFGWAITTSSVDFKLKIYFKEGRYKIVIDNVVYHAILSSNGSLQPLVQAYGELRNNKMARKFKGSINDALLAFVNGLKKSVKSNTSEATNSSW